MTSVESLDLSALRKIPLPAPGEDKEERGRVLVIGGSSTVPGAVILAGSAALRAGAGKLQVATVSSVALSVATALPESMVLALPETAAGEIAESLAKLDQLSQQASAILVGPGMAASAELVELVRQLSRGAVPVILDAGALSQQIPSAGASGSFVLTPHAGELAELCGVAKEDVQASPLEYASDLAKRLRSVVIAKGADTHVVDQSGQAWLHRGGVPGLGTSGSGDVLAGVIAGLVARGALPLHAALWGVWLHAEAGRSLSASVGELGFLAREIAPLVPGLMSEADQATSNER